MDNEKREIARVHSPYIAREIAAARVCGTAGECVREYRSVRACVRAYGRREKEIEDTADEASAELKIEE